MIIQIISANNGFIITDKHGRYLRVLENFGTDIKLRLGGIVIEVIKELEKKEDEKTNVQD